MAENKYYPIRIRNDEEKELLNDYLELCKKNNTDGSSEIRKFMKKYVAKYKEVHNKSENQARKIKEPNKDIKADQKGTIKSYPSVKEYLDKIGYVPSYVKKN